jgi:hypothetical protein
MNVVRRGRPSCVVFAAACSVVLTACTLDMSGLGGPGAALDDGEATSPQAQDAAPPESFDASALPDGQKAPPVPSGSGGDDGAPGEDSSQDAPLTQTTPEAGASPCDLDGDGHLALGPACNGDDCCDIDANAHPGQTTFFTQLDQCGSYDYDCDGKVTPQYGAVSCQWQGFTCSGSGFDQVPACGASGQYETCNLGFFTCNPSADMRVQACR